MPAEIIDGKKIAAQIRSELKKNIMSLKEKGIVPGLAAVLVGDNPASALYVKMKSNACNEVGIYSDVIKRDKSSIQQELLYRDEFCTQQELLELVYQLNNREDIDGILVQSPLPGHIDEAAITFAIDPKKDVDGFHPVNQGLLLAGRPAFEPATPMGIVELLERSGNCPDGKEVVILGRGFLVGRPLSIMLSVREKNGNATVTVCHTGTTDIASHTKKADIIVAAIGRAQFLKGDMVKPGAVVIDVGTNQISDPTHPKGKRLVGDVDFDSVKEVAGAITPVPGGVGPMTIASLLTNTLKACKSRRGIS
jgi:methylenetetrahydrofolate dehydrogenase (NADP+)/methenyltetrahydrofolate cyclohydrolase